MTFGRACKVSARAQVDGPCHFTANTLRPLGPTLLKRRLIAASGWRVAVVPYYAGTSSASAMSASCSSTSRCRCGFSALPGRKQSPTERLCKSLGASRALQCWETSVLPPDVHAKCERKAVKRRSCWRACRCLSICSGQPLWVSLHAVLCSKGVQSAHLPGERSSFPVRLQTPVCQCWRRRRAGRCSW